MKMTYNDVYAMAEYGRREHGWFTYPVQLCCKTLVEQGYRGALEIYPNKDFDGDGLPDVTYSSITYAANHGNASYRQKGIEGLSQ